MQSSLPVLRQRPGDSVTAQAVLLLYYSFQAQAQPMSPPPDQRLHAALTHLLRALMPDTGPGKAQVMVVLQTHLVIFIVNPG